MWSYARSCRSFSMWRRWRSLIHARCMVPRPRTGVIGRGQHSYWQRDGGLTSRSTRWISARRRSSAAHASRASKNLSVRRAYCNAYAISRARPVGPLRVTAARIFSTATSCCCRTASPVQPSSSPTLYRLTSRSRSESTARSRRVREVFVACVIASTASRSRRTSSGVPRQGERTGSQSVASLTRRPRRRE